MVALDFANWPIEFKVAGGIALLFLLGYLGSLYGRDRDKFRTMLVLIGYTVTFSIAFVISYNSETHKYLYFGAFFLGALTAFAEIIQKFGDEPLEALSTFQALLYHVLNGLISVAALEVLLLYPEFYTEETAGSLEKIQIVLAAGLGSMLVMRSKLFNVKVGQNEIAFGPEQIINVFLRFMEHSIDRIRASARIDFVIRVMSNLDFEMIEAYTLTMLDSTQALADKKELIKDIKDIKNDVEVTETQLKSYRLGFLLLNALGENFLERLYEERHTSWLIEAPGETESTVWRRLPWTTGPVNFFAYGLDMSPEVLAKRLNWITNTGRSRLPERVGLATLPGYQLAFNASPEDENAPGAATIIENPDHTVEGVLYRLPPRAMEFLDHRMHGCKREKVKVKSASGSEINAQTYVATSPVQAAKPDPDYQERLIATAEQQGLSESYMKGLV